MIRARLLLVSATATIMILAGCAGPRATTIVDAAAQPGRGGAAPRTASAAALQPTLLDFRARLPAAEGQIPAIARAADAAAERLAAHPLALISTPTAIQEGFADELSNRAGGLSNVLYPELRPKEVTPDDVVLFAVRSWEKDGPQVIKLFPEYRSKGWLVIVFGSERGKPADLPVDFFIDNGAPDGSAAHARINAIVNAMHGWEWCCEYVGAMTRRGKVPGVLISASFLKYDVMDTPLQTSPGGRQWQGEATRSSPPEALARAYFERVRKLTDQLASPRTQGQLAEAADVIARRLAAGRKVMVSGIGHVVMSEMMHDHHAGWKGFNPGDPKTSFKANLQEGDLLFWIGYLGMDSRYADYAGAIRKTQCDLIVTLAPDEDPSLNGPWAMVVIEQWWGLGDCEVDIPCPPWRMGPISGINGTLVLRMLDDEVVERQAKLPATQPVGKGD